MKSYNIEGVNFPRPFRIRRFGHLGLNLNDIDAGVDFYGRLLGFEMTDLVEVAKLAPPGIIPEGLDTRVPFLSHNADHHSLIIAHPDVGPFIGDPDAHEETTLSHFTWQVGSLHEVKRAHDFLKENGVPINRTGRDMPGSNWHCYFQTPEGQICEVYYGMEQVGINGNSKPLPYYERRFDGDDTYTLPQMSDFDEKEMMKAKGVTMEGGYERTELPGGDARFDVGGSLISRPFKVTSHGPIAHFVLDMDESLKFYCDLLGFKITETVNYKGHDCVFLRHGNEHHSLKLFPLELRSVLGLSEHTRTASIGVRVGSYKQLRDAIDWLKSEGVTFIEQPVELSPGMEYCAYALDNEGHCIQLYYYMESVAWDGSRRPEEARRKLENPWPETLDAIEDTYADQTYMGPLG